LAAFTNQVFSTQIGLSGAIFTPSPFTRPIEDASLYYSANFFQQKDSSTLAVDQGARHFTSLSGGVTDQIEVAVAQEFFTGAVERRDRLYWSLKYQIPSDSLPVAFSFILPSSRTDYFSMAASTGWRPFYMGIGGNYSGRPLNEAAILSGQPFGVASFGGYRMRRVLTNPEGQLNRQETVGNPDPFFAFIGGEVRLGNNVDWLYDYDGDVFASGLRLSLDTSTFQLAYITSGDYDKLFSRSQENIVASAQYRF
jgi:hypothetical protein